MLISATGQALALTTPPGFFERHEAEREAARQRDRDRFEKEEAERLRPLGEKAAIVFELAQHGLKALVVVVVVVVVVVDDVVVVIVM
jgi:hypothetical protein